MILKLKLLMVIGYSNPSYAKDHGKVIWEIIFRIIRKTVSAKDLWWDGGDINEWGYYK